MGGIIKDLIGGGSQTTVPPTKIPDTPATARRGAGSAVEEANRRRRAMQLSGRSSTIMGGSASGQATGKSLLGG